MSDEVDTRRRNLLKAGVAAAATGPFVLNGLTDTAFAASSSKAGAAETTTFRAKLDAGLKVLDPIWTTAYPTRTHGYLVYDTLFAMDENLHVQPQMVEHYEVSDDHKTYTFTLREGLKWHDGDPVTSEDCVPSIKRWGARDSMGGILMGFTDRLEIVDEKTFKLILKEPFGLVIQALGKMTSNVPFMMKKAQAMTDPYEQITTVNGSGPFKFVEPKFRPGVSSLYVKNEAYVPRDEPPSNLAGGKVPRVEQVELVTIPEAITAVQALIAGEIDYNQVPPPDLLPRLKRADGIKVAVFNELGNLPVLRPNFLWPPFDNMKARQAVLWSMSQKKELIAAVGREPWLYNICHSMYPCGTPLATPAGSKAARVHSTKALQDFDKASRLLEESGYNGDPVVILHAVDDPIIDAQMSIAEQSLRNIGMNLDVQAMTFSTLVQRRAIKKKPSEGGWNLFETWFTGSSFINPLVHPAIGAGCEDAWFGWPCDKKIQQMRAQFARETDPEKRKQLAEDIQVRAFHLVMYVPFGQYYQPVAFRDDKWDGLLSSTVPVFWNVHKA